MLIVDRVEISMQTCKPGLEKKIEIGRKLKTQNLRALTSKRDFEKIMRGVITASLIFSFSFFINLTYFSYFFTFVS